ncbi:MAG: hypothetical protein SFY70_05495 [Bacteroidia bacterium]|nr:hypothetical protein [Bacteroidia bacterium]
MNPLYLYRKVRKEALDAEEATWLANELKVHPYAHVLHLIRAGHLQHTQEATAGSARQLAALYAPSRQRLALYLDEKLARKLEAATESVKKQASAAGSTKPKPAPEAPKAPAAPVVEAPAPEAKAPLAPQPPAAPEVKPAPEVATPKAQERPEPVAPATPPAPAPEAKPEAQETPAPKPPVAGGLKITPVKSAEVGHLSPPPVAPPKVELTTPSQSPTLRPEGDPLPETKAQTTGGEKTAPTITLTEVPAPVLNQGLQTMLQVRTGMYLPLVDKIGRELAAYKADLPAVASSPAPASPPETVARVEPPAVEAPAPTPVPEVVAEAQAEPVVTQAPPVAEAPVAEPPKVEAEVPDLPATVHLPVAPTETPAVSELPTDEADAPNPDDPQKQKRERISLEQLAQEQQQQVEQGVDDLKHNLLRLIQAQMSGMPMLTVEVPPETTKPAAKPDHIAAITEIVEKAKTLHETTRVVVDPPAAKLPEPKPEVPKPTEKEKPVEGEALKGTAESMLRFRSPSFDEKPLQLNVEGIDRRKAKATETPVTEAAAPAPLVESPVPPVTETPSEAIPPVAELAPTPKPEPPAPTPAEVTAGLGGEASFKRFKSLEDTQATTGAQLPTPKVELVPAPEAIAPPATPSEAPAAENLKGKVTTESFNRFVAPKFDRRFGMINDPLPPQPEAPAQTLNPIPVVALPPLESDPALGLPHTSAPVAEVPTDTPLPPSVNPVYDTRREDTEVQPVSTHLEEPLAEPIPPVRKPAPLGVDEPTAKDGGKASFGRFVQPTFGLETVHAQPETVPQPEATAEPIGPSETPQTPLPPAAEVPPAAPTALGAPIVSESMRRFVPFEPSGTPEPTAKPEATVPEEAPKVTSLKVPPPTGKVSVGMDRFVDLEPSPKLEAPASSDTPPATPLPEAPPATAEAPPAPEPTGEQTFTYRHGELELQIVLRPEQLKFFAADPTTLFAQAATEVLAPAPEPEDSPEAPETPVTFSRTTVVEAPSAQLGDMDPEVIGKIKAAIDEETWQQLEEAFLRPPVVSEAGSEPATQVAPKPVGLAPLNASLTIASLEVNPELLEPAAPAFGEVIEQQEDAEEDFIRKIGLESSYANPELPEDQHLAAELPYELGGAGGEYTAPQTEPELNDLLRIKNLPHPSQITLQTIQQKFLEKMITSMTEGVVKIPASGPEEPTIVAATPPVADTVTDTPADTPSDTPAGNTVDEALAKFNALEPVISQKISSLKQAPPAPESEEPLPAHPDTLKNPLEETGEVSETLAELLVKQGKLTAAKAIYFQLSMKHPEKSAYFAARIADLG